MIEVVEYDPDWPRQFEVLRHRVEAALAGVPVVAIEHVGSTSVPGLAAKPVIDVDIVVPRVHVEPASQALLTLGYQPLGTLGVPDRWAFRAPADTIRTNTYVTVEGCLSLRNHLAVRDVLRRDPGLRQAYADLKWQLASTHDDVDAYVRAKSPVVQRILELAGLSDDERRSIAAINEV